MTVRKQPLREGSVRFGIKNSYHFSREWEEGGKGGVVDEPSRLQVWLGRNVDAKSTMAAGK